MNGVTRIKQMSRRLLIVAVGVALAISAAACGSSQTDGINRSDANTLLSELEQVRSFLDAGSCISAGSHAVTFLS